jgi:hypothetical protein
LNPKKKKKSIIYNPENSPFDNNSVNSKHNTTSSANSSSKHNNGSRSNKSKHGKFMHNLTDSLSNNNADSEPNMRSFSVDSFVYDPSGSRFSSNRSSLPSCM